MKGLTLSIILCLLSGAAQVRAVARDRSVVSVPVARNLTPDCVADAARKHDVPLAALVGILAAEGGTVGIAVRNANGSFDLGPFQVNSCNLNELAGQGYAPEAILRDGCVNAHAAAWILRREYERTGNTWMAVGAYHSRTPSLRDAYTARVRKHLARMARMGSGLRPDEGKP